MCRAGGARTGVENRCLTAHSHFTICHALHFNSTVQSGLHVHTAQIQQSICYHWIPSNAHTWHLRIQLMYNLLHLCILLCVYICVHNVECVHTVYRLVFVYTHNNKTLCIYKIKKTNRVHCLPPWSAWSSFRNASLKWTETQQILHKETWEIHYIAKSIGSPPF